jgi:hypothetical protein
MFYTIRQEMSQRERSAVVGGESFSFDGVTSLSTTEGGVTGPADSHKVRVDVTDTEVVYAMEGIGGGARDRVRSTSRAVREHYREVKALKDRTAYRNRPIKSLLADKAKRIESRAKTAIPTYDGGRPMETCPNCNNGAGVSTCGLCEATGWVTPRQAEDWRDTHGE